MLVYHLFFKDIFTHTTFTHVHSTTASGWRGGRQGLFNPDIDHQEGDVLFSNTYLTTRIPANWNDPEYVPLLPLLYLVYVIKIYVRLMSSC